MPTGSLSEKPRRYGSAFTFLGLQHGPVPAVCRYALSSLSTRQPCRGLSALRPASGALKSASPNVLQRLLQARKIEEARRGQISALLQAGWASGVDAVQQMQCLPVGVYAQVKKGKPLRFCNLSYLCPFCWCRTYSVPLLKRLADLCFPDDPELFQRPPTSFVPVRLVELKLQVDYPLRKSPLQLLKETKALRRKGWPASQVLGGFQLISLEPVPPDTRAETRARAGSRWRWTRRLLLVQHESSPQLSELGEPDAPPGGKAYDIRRPRVTQVIAWKDLVGVAGRLTRYPNQLLWGPVPRVLQLMEARREYAPGGARCSSYFGILRGSRDARRAAAYRLCGAPFTQMAAQLAPDDPAPRSLPEMCPARKEVQFGQNSELAR